MSNMRKQNLRKDFDSNAAAKNPQDSKVLEPNSGMSMSEKATNKVEQYETPKGKVSGAWGGENTGS